jgi:mutator family transposase
MAINASDLNGQSVLPEGDFGVAFLMLDGLRRPQPDNPHEVALCVLGLGGDGRPIPLALRVAQREDEHAWRSLLAHLRARGIGREALLVVCDDHPALLKAVQAVYPEVPMQVSVAHRLLALARKVDAPSRAACLAEARAIFAAPDLNTAVARFRAWRASWIKLGNRAVASLESDLASCLTFFRFPPHLWAKIRTVNVVERAFREARRTAPSASADTIEHVSIDEPILPGEIPVPGPEVLHQVVFGTSPALTDAVTVEPQEADSIMNADMPESRQAEQTREMTSVSTEQESPADVAGDPRYDKYAVIAALSGESLGGDKDVPAHGVMVSEAAMVAEHPELAVGIGHEAATIAGAPEAGQLTDLSRDADFMWWLKERRNRAHSRTVRMTVVAATIVSGLMTGIALTRLI